MAKYIFGPINVLNYKDFEEKFNEMGSNGYRYASKFRQGKFIHKFEEDGKNHKYDIFIDPNLGDVEFNRGRNIGRLKLVEDGKQEVKNYSITNKNTINFYLILLLSIALPSISLISEVDTDIEKISLFIPLLFFLPIGFWYLKNYKKINQDGKPESLSVWATYLYGLGLVISIVNSIRIILRMFSKEEMGITEIFIVLGIVAVGICIALLGFKLFNIVKQKWFADTTSLLPHYIFMGIYIVAVTFLVFFIIVAVVAKTSQMG